MQSKKIVSIRLLESEINALDEIGGQRDYRVSRTDLIEAAIRLLIVANKRGYLGRLLRFRPAFGDVVNRFEFDYHRSFT